MKGNSVYLIKSTDFYYYFMIFIVSPELLAIMSHTKIYPENLRPGKNPKGLSVRVDMSFAEIKMIFNQKVREAQKESADQKWSYYKTYLRQIFPSSSNDIPFDPIIDKLSRLRDEVQSRMDMPNYKDILMVKRLIHENKYVSKTTKRTGLVVKLFHTYYDGRDVFVKTYLYDSQCESFRRSITANFKNEVLFQSYAKQLQSDISFISPELYSWGKIRRYTFDKYEYPFECLFLIMEYIPFVTLNEAVYSTDNMTHIYERVQQIDTELSSKLLHHNDLHKGNIMVSLDETSGGEKSPYPDIVLLDFGEASLGPSTPLYQYGMKS